MISALIRIEEQHKCLGFGYPSYICCDVFRLKHKTYNNIEKAYHLVEGSFGKNIFVH